MSILQSALSRLLRPLIRILLQRGMTFDEFSEVARQTYVEVAEDDFQIAGRKQTIARISMLTGIQRKEASRLIKQRGHATPELDSAYNRGVRVTSGWRRDDEFSDDDGPAALPLEGSHSFAALVKKYSGDIPFKAVLDEFLRVGIVTINADNEVTLTNSAGYVPTRSETDQLHILGQSAADLFNTFAHNLGPDEDKRLQLTVAYNNLAASSVAALKSRSQDEGFALLKQFDEWLSTQDRDARQAPTDDTSQESDRYRAGVGIYFFQEPYQEDTST